MEALAKQSPPGAKGIIYLPYLSSQGIIAPIVEPAARAEFFGLTNEHRRADLIRAVYEGMAFSIRDGYDVISPHIHEIRLSGGASQSAFFCHMIADITSKCVLVPAGSEFGAKGAALLAAVGIGRFDSVAAALNADSASVQVYRPDAGMRPLCDSIYTTYGDLREGLLPVWRQHVARLKHLP